MISLELVAASPQFSIPNHPADQCRTAVSRLYSLNVSMEVQNGLARNEVTTVFGILRIYVLN